MKKNLILVLIAFGLFKLVPVFAQEVSYPVSQLGNCASREECFNYCENPNNYAACQAYDRDVLHNQVLADQTTKITFPIPELGNCADMNSCKLYCGQPQNQAACQSFAAAHKINTGQDNFPNKERILSEARQFLGCSDLDSCRNFCQNPQNRNRCKEFSIRLKTLIPQPTGPQMPSSFAQALFQAAKTELGCDSDSSCKNLCDQPVNQERCLGFLKRHLLINPVVSPLMPTTSSSPSAVKPPLPLPTTNTIFPTNQ